jgi:hypothetical protein
VALGAAGLGVVQDRALDVDSDAGQPVAVVASLCLVGRGGFGRGFDLVDPVLAVDEVQARGAEVDRGVAGVGGVVDGFAQLDGGAEVFGADATGVEPQLPAAVVEVLDVDAAHVVFVDHRTIPGW